MHVQVTPLHRPLPPGEGRGEGLPARSDSSISSHSLRATPNASAMRRDVTLRRRRSTGLDFERTDVAARAEGTSLPSLIDRETRPREAGAAGGIPGIDGWASGVRQVGLGWPSGFGRAA